MLEALRIHLKKKTRIMNDGVEPHLEQSVVMSHSIPPSAPHHTHHLMPTFHPDHPRRPPHSWMEMSFRRGPRHHKVHLN